MIGERYTVTAHSARTAVGGIEHAGGWHCEVLTEPFGDPPRVCVREIVPDGRGWRRRMSTGVFVSALVPLGVDVDLFGNPAVAP